MIRCPFPKAAIESAKAHAVSQFPKESCGYIIGNEYVPMQNEAPNPERNFDMAWPIDQKVECVIHSHTDLQESPSAQDMQQQIATAVPWGIIVCGPDSAKEPFFWGDQLPIAPLVGREFRHGVYDCYSLIRDYYRMEFNVLLKDFPRDHDWWKSGGNMYEEGFAEAGFFTISQSEVRKGDVFLANILSQVVHHGGVFLENGLILHHFGLGRHALSRREGIERWTRHIKRWVRHESQK